MARKNDKINMPMSTAGITRYFENYHTRLELQPMQVLFLVGLIVVLIILLHLYGRNILGF